MDTMDTVEIGIIGGSGLYQMAELSDVEERTIATPFGDPSGPYIVLPLVGPCNARDAVGRAADYLALSSYLDTEAFYAFVGTTALSEAEPALEQDAAAREAALDLYAASRSAYEQRREAAIRDGVPGADPDYDGIFTP